MYTRVRETHRKLKIINIRMTMQYSIAVNAEWLEAEGVWTLDEEKSMALFTRKDSLADS